MSGHNVPMFLWRNLENYPWYPFLSGGPLSPEEIWINVKMSAKIKIKVHAIMSASVGREHGDFLIS